MAYVETTVAEGCSKLRLVNTEANLLTSEVINELSRSLKAAEGSSGAIMLCGGDKFFSNGLDLNWALSCGPQELRNMFLSLGGLVLQMLECKVPLISALKGHAIGAGKTLFAACDHRYGSTGRVLIGMPEILLGVPNPYFADQLTRHIAGDAVASDLIYTGRLVAAESLVACGLVNQVCGKDDVEDNAWKTTLQFASLPRSAFAECKAMRVQDLCSRIRERVDVRIDNLVEIWFSADTQKRLTAAASRLKK